LQIRGVEEELECGAEEAVNYENEVGVKLMGRAREEGI